MSLSNHQATHYSPLDAEVCRRARMSRDPRFDGEFFLGVRTTGIYCRPICAARPPAEKNVSYYHSAAHAAEAGYRPCLRCRPESAPNSPAWRGTSTTVQRALGLIQAGALNEGSMAQLAARLGVGERYLRKLFQAEVGISPQAVAQNQRLLFAKKLLLETDLPMTSVAFAAGYSSVRRFNSAIRDSFTSTPGDMRKRRRGKVAQGSNITLQLHYRPPYDWDGVLNFFRRHAITGVEQVGSNTYQRNISVEGEPGSMCVSPVAGRNALQLELCLPDQCQLMPTVARVRRMFDLDANPGVIADTLNSDTSLAALLNKYPGIRSPSHWSVYEASVRAVVGQQVSIAAARQVCSRLVDACCAPDSPKYFPAPGEIARLADSQFPMPTRRRDTLRTVCKQSKENGGALDLSSLAALKGIGPWTVNLVAMRGYGSPDVFPPGDLGLVKAFAALSTDEIKLAERADQWRPWRSYAANLLWRSFCE